MAKTYTQLVYWPLVAVIVCTVLGLRPQDGTGTPPPTYQSFNRALDLLAQDSLAHAAQRLQDLLPTLPPAQRAIGHNNLAYMLLRQINPQMPPAQVRSLEQQAHTHLKRALGLDPTNEVARFNYELLAQRMQQPPPQTPPPPKPEDNPPPPPRNNRVPNETRGQRMTYEAQDDAAVEYYLGQLRKEPVQYFHQARKAVAGMQSSLGDQQPW